MAAPQRENGFTGIANEILQQVMRRPFSAQALRVLLCLWRETYGWQRSSAEFSLGLVERETGIPKPRVSKILKALLGAQVVEQIEVYSRTSPARYAFQKNYELWAIESGGSVLWGNSPGGNGGSVLQDTGGVSSRTPIKERVKEKLQQGVSSERTPPQQDEMPDLTDRVVRQLTHLQPSGLSQEDRKTVAELLRNTDKTPRRVLEAVTDATRETQQHRRNKQLSTPVRYALRIAGRMLSEPEPMQGPEQEFVRAPEGWCPPGYQSRNGAAD